MQKVTKYLNLLVIFVLLAFTLPESAAAEEPKSKDPIKISRHDWTGNIITTSIMSEVLKRAGYNTQFIQAEYMGQFPGLESGDLHVAVEIWATSAIALLEESTATGRTEKLGETGLVGMDRYWYPKYVEEQCPGLPDWRALNDCAEMFSTLETAPKGRLLLFPSAWGGNDDERIEALGLNYEIVRAGSEASLYAEVKSAYDRKAPILSWLYEPHWAPQRYPGEYVALPPYEPECYDDPSWGVNPDLAYDCEKPSGPIWKVVWSGVKDKWPTAYNIIKAYELNNAEMGEMIGEIDQNGKSAEEVVAKWMTDNEDRWQAWISE